jgi:sec-independent protein translocase protein TatC
VVNSSLLVRKRKIAIVIITVVAAFAVQSPDPFSMLAMMIPLIVLYEISIWLIRALEKAGEEPATAATAQDSV